MLAVAAAAVAACQAGPLRPALVSEHAVILGLPLVQQDALYECGLVSISALCGYHRVALPADEREQLVRMAAEREGLSGAELREVLEPLGLEVHVFPGTLDRSPTGLYHHIDAGRPLLVMTLERWGAPHYSLVCGYDETLGHVYLLDPRRGAVMWPTAAFERIWERAERFTLLAVPAGAGDAGA